MPDNPPIGVVGVGWVGLVTAGCFAELGHEVWCRDIDPAKLASLRDAKVPFHEPGLQDVVERNAARLHFEDELAPVLDHARLLFVCVDTPPTYSGDADLSRVEAVVDELPDSSEHAIVMKSTVPCGTGASIRRRLGELGKSTLGYAANPEFLQEGSAVRDFMDPDRVVIGSEAPSDWVEKALVRLYEPLGSPIVRTDVASAEMIKLASNAFLATKISFINEIANVCEELGADVSEVAAGMGLDPRIGQSFLRAGIGYGGSCLVGDETVLVRSAGRIRLVALEELFDDLAGEAVIDQQGNGLVAPRELEALSWRPGADEPEFLPVETVTRRPWSGEVVEIRTKMGRRLRTTPDHPFVVSDGAGSLRTVKHASELGREDWLPLAQGGSWHSSETEGVIDLKEAIAAAEVQPSEVIVRPREKELGRIMAAPAAERNSAGAMLGTARNGTYVPTSIVADESFWRIVGLYIAEGHCSVDGRRHRLQWSFHPTKEEDLVDEVVWFWERLGVKASVYRRATTTCVVVSSRLLAGWWLEVLGLGANCYEQRIPDAAWALSPHLKRALLTGLWRGDGSWSLVAGGPNVVLEYGTASRELIDGIMRLLGDLGIVARQKVGRTAKSTRDNYWLVVSGADQVETLLGFVPPEDRVGLRCSLDLQKKRIAPTGFRPHDGAAWVRVLDTAVCAHDGFVYSLEVPASETFVATGGLVVHNCFPKDVSALKQLAGNSGYHFQLLTAVIEVNELQKRRVVNKLKRHLGSLVGKRIALLGLAFKPNTDDMREASSIVLAARLQAEGAIVRAYDPVAEDAARAMMTGVEMCDSAMEALDGVNAAVIVTEWPEFAALDLAAARERMADPVIVDGRNILSADAVHAAGLVYEGIGRT
jgi:UDPglucose 6-dehydrogenase